MIRDIQDEIIKLKKEKNICILAHSYQGAEILETADFTGDSYMLSVKAKQTEADTVIMCGVRFMAETVKILSPEKRVFLANPSAGCPMAEQFSKEDILNLKKQYPGYAVAAYVNTTAELKTVCDVCVTSSSAVKIVKNMPEKDIIFIPDCNLGSFVQKEVPEKNIKLLNGGCPYHGRITYEDVKTARSLHPNALLLVHPECKAEVTENADYVGSTADIMKFAAASEKKEFIIGTEISITEHLQYQCPDKKFYNLSNELVCSQMKCTTLMDLYNCIKGEGGEEIFLEDSVIKAAASGIQKMIDLG